MKLRRGLLTALFSTLFCLLVLSAQAEGKPEITRQPVSISKRCFLEFTLSTEASGSSLSYQWQYRVNGGTWTDWRNMTSATATAIAALDMNAWEFRCIVTGSGGRTVTDTVTVEVLPNISTYGWPKLGSLTLGSTVRLRMDDRCQNLSYQWYYSRDAESWEVWEGKTGSSCEFVVEEKHDGMIVDVRAWDQYGHMTEFLTVNGSLSNFTIHVTGVGDHDEEKTLFYTDNVTTQNIGNIPDSFLQQLDYSGHNVELLHGDNISIKNGIVAPNGWSDGDSMILVDGRKIRIHVVHYGVYYAEKVIDDYIRDNIAPGMTEYQKMEKICQFIAARDYGSGTSCANLVITGHGDCYASTNTILFMSKKLGINAMDNNGSYKNGGASNHRNAVALLDGKYCIVEAGTGGKAPRSYWIDSYDTPYEIYLFPNTNEVATTTFMNLDHTLDVVVPSAIGGRTVTMIGFRTFVGRTEITSVTIPDTVRSIENEAFGNCSRLRTVNIPASVSFVASDAFYGCDSLTSINVAQDNPYYKSINGVLYSKDGTELIAYPGGLSGTYRVPDGVTTIHEDAFAGVWLNRLTLPESMVTIPKNAFTDSFIYSFDLPGNLKRIEEYAFYNADTSIYTLPDGLEYIGPYAFYGTRHMETAIPSTVTVIGANAFRSRNSSLIVFSPGCDPEIGENAFSNVTVSVYEGTGPWQYAMDNGVTYRLQNGNGRIPLQGSWFSLKYTSFTCNGKPIDFSSGLSVQNELSIKYNRDYILSASENVRPGAGKLSVIGIGYYTGTVKLDYTIDLNDADGNGVIDTRDIVRKRYGSYAANNISMLPGNLLTIEADSFAGTSFQVLAVPKTVRSISDNAFAGNSKIVLILPDESWVPWAEKNGYTYIVSID